MSKPFAERPDERRILSVREINEEISAAVQHAFPATVWVRGEVQRLPDDAARDDLAQFAVIYERYVDRIYAYCACRVGIQDAEDVTSQVFVKALGALGGYRGGSVAAWLFRIARSCVVDHLRYRRSPVSLEAHDIDLPAGGLDVFEQVADRDPLDVGGPDAEVLRHPRQGDVDHRAVDDRHEQPEDVDGHHLGLVRHAPRRYATSSEASTPER